MSEQQSGLGGNTYDAHHLPKVRLDTHQAAQRAQAYRQAAYEAADDGYTGHSAGLPTDHRPFESTDLTPGSVKRAGVRTHTPVSLSQDDEYEPEEDESYYTTRLPTSARRYHVSPEAVYQQGNQRVHIRYVDVPPRSSRHAQLPPQRESHTDDYEGASPSGSVRARCQVPESQHTKIGVNKGESEGGVPQQTDSVSDILDSHEAAFDCKN